MAGGKAHTASNAYFNHLFMNSAYSAPANLYVGLFSTNPTAGNEGTELTGNGYTRSAAIPAGTGWTLTEATFIGAATIKNASEIAFGPASTAQWTVTGFGVWDAANAGNLLYWGTVTGAPVTIAVGATATWAADQLVLTEN